MSVFNPHLIEEAREALRGVVRETPLQYHEWLSEKFGAKIYLKREDLQPLMKRMDAIGMSYELLKSDSPIFRFVI